jgi:hypothetical protein
VGAAVLVGAGVYALMVFALRMEEFDMVWSLLRRRGQKQHSA